MSRVSKIMGWYVSMCLLPVYGQVLFSILFYKKKKVDSIVTECYVSGLIIVYADQQLGNPMGFYSLN